MTTNSRNENFDHALEVCELQDDELDGVTGGLRSVSSVMRAIGDGLTKVASGGEGPETVTIWGIVMSGPPPK